MRKFVITIFITLLVFLDLGSKIFVEDTVFGVWKNICMYPDLNNSATPEYCTQNKLSITDFFAIELSYNTGIAFSLPLQGIPLQIVTIVLILSIIVYYIREEYKKNSRLIDLAYSLIIGGALSHAYERIFVGHVVDFIHVKYFAILNLADILISIGAILLIFHYGYYHRKHR